MHENKTNGKRYIGLTKNSPYKRWGKDGHGYLDNKQSLFHRAIKKYGWDNFEHIILFDNLSKEEACEKEVEYIKKYKTQNPDFGYNIQPGGQLGNTGVSPSEETRKKMSDAKIGRHLSEEHKKKISESCMGHKPAVHSEEGLRRIREFNVGKKLSEETKQKISDSLSGIKRSPETLKKRKDNNPMNVAVYCPELNMTFQTIQDAATYTGARRSNIQKCLRGLRNTAGKDEISGNRFHWEKVEKDAK